jgi:hypothetical protein
MAERFGGKYSPGGGAAPGAPAVPPRRSRVGMRVNLLFFAPLPLLIRAFGLEAAGLVQTLAGFGLLILAAWLTREGERAQEAYEARKVARRPALPRKLAGAVLTGIGIALACIPDATGLAGPLLLGALGTILHVLSFGPDPLRDKGMEGIDTYAQDRAARAVDGAEKYLDAMQDAVLRARDRTLEARVDRFQSAARAMFRQIEEDPRDLVASKKYLTVYLMGARDATVKFADLYARSREPGLRADYEALLDDLERSFAARTRALLEDNRDDLNVEIEVLRERLDREGVTLN